MTFDVVCDSVTCDFVVTGISDRPTAEGFAKANQWTHNSPLYRHCPGHLFVVEETKIDET